MKKNSPSESPLYNPGTQPSQKKNEPEESAIGQGASLLKKNEFTMIIVAALAVTVLVFFFFFRGSSTQESRDQKAVTAKGVDPAAPGFEDRISALEISLAKIASSSEHNENQVTPRALSDLDERMTRVETAINLKLDTMIERVNKLETRLGKLTVAASTPPPSSHNTGAESESKVKKPAFSPKKEVQAAKKKAVTAKAVKKKKVSQFHTVQKGETLWSISQKYKTNVEAIRKLNNLKPEDNIHPGTNLMVR